MHILTVGHYYENHQGGVEQVSLRLCDRWSEKGHCVTWAASQPAPPEHGQAFHRLPMATANFLEHHFDISHPLWSWGSLVRLWRSVAQCDVLHLHDSLYLGNYLAFGAAVCFDKPVVVTQHIPLVPYAKRWRRFLMKWATQLGSVSLLSHSDRVVFESREVQRFFVERVHFRAVPAFIATGVDKERFFPLTQPQRAKFRQKYGLADQQKVFLFVGRFTEKKGLPWVRALAQEYAQHQWWVVGSVRGKAQEDPRDWRLPQVRCLGSLSPAELVPYYQMADLLVLPSVGEGFPLAIQESMACGTPALMSEETAKACPGVEKVSVVCNLRWDQLKAAIDGFIDDEKNAGGKRKLCRKFSMQHWDWQKSADSYLKLFAELAGSRQRAQQGKFLRKRKRPAQLKINAPQQHSQS